MAIWDFLLEHEVLLATIYIALGVILATWNIRMMNFDLGPSTAAQTVACFILFTVLWPVQFVAWAYWIFIEEIWRRVKEARRARI